MVAVARREPEPARVVLDAQVGPRVRLRVWEAPGPLTAKPNAHGDVELAWIDEGAIGYGVGRARFEVERGRAMVVPEGVEHATMFFTAMRGAALHVDSSLVAEIADAMGARGPSIGLVADASRVAALGAMLALEATRSDRGALLAADALVEAMLVTALRGAANDEGASSSDPGIARAVRFVEERYADALSIDDLARAARMSRFHFSRRFRAATGSSPYQFLQSVRVARAAEMLRRGRAGVTEVAYAVGFSDPSRFAQAFRARYGKSPSEARTPARRRSPTAS